MLLQSRLLHWIRNPIKRFGILFVGIIFIIIAIFNFSIGPSATKLIFGSHGFETRELTAEEISEFYASQCFILILGIIVVVISFVSFYYSREPSDRYKIIDVIEVDDALNTVNHVNKEEDPENDEYIQKLFKKHGLD